MNQSECEDIGSQCDCPGCQLAEKMREIIAHGFPPDLLVTMTLDVLQTVAEEYGIVVETSEQETVH